MLLESLHQLDSSGRLYLFTNDSISPTTRMLIRECPCGDSDLVHVYDLPPASSPEESFALLPSTQPWDPEAFCEDTVTKNKLLACLLLNRHDQIPAHSYDRLLPSEFLPVLSYLVEKGIPIRINSAIFSKFEQSVFPHNNFSVTTEQQHQWIQIVVSDLIKTSYPLNMIHYAACLRRYSDTFEQTPVADLSAQAANDLLPAEVAAFAHNIDRSQLPAVLTHLTKNMSDDHFAKVVCSIIAGAEVATWNNLILHNTDSNICTALWNLALERLSVGSRELNRICSVVLDRWDTIGDVVVTEELFAGIPEDAVFERLQKSEGEFWLQYAKDRFGPNHPQIEEVLKRRAKQMLPDASAR